MEHPAEGANYLRRVEHTDANSSFTMAIMTVNDRTRKLLCRNGQVLSSFARPEDAVFMRTQRGHSEVTVGGLTRKKFHVAGQR